MELSKEKMGVFTGSYVVYSFTGEKFFIWVVDYVFGFYGIGFIMVVFVYDECDYEFV